MRSDKLVFIDFISFIFISYLLVYLPYFLYIAYCSSVSKLKEVQSRNYAVEHTYTFNFIIHSQSDEQTLPALIDSIKKGL